jgi:chromosome segregation ATPase
MENRYRMLSDDKARGEHEARLRLDRGCDEIGEARRALEELKFLIAEKTKIGCNLMDELQRSKRCIDDKTYDASRIKEELVAKCDLVQNDQKALSAICNDIDSQKV